MSPSDYTSTGGGALKLKGVGIDKKKKKKKPKPANDEATADTADPPLKSQDDARQNPADELDKKDEGASSSAPKMSEELEHDLLEHQAKTEAERRHEERRRKRLHERLKREGVKTHKERVEELNRYLSAQSDHHDMPKIGPG